jgi:hypothetical protein
LCAYNLNESLLKISLFWWQKSLFEDLFSGEPVDFSGRKVLAAGEGLRATALAPAPSQNPAESTTNPHRSASPLLMEELRDAAAASTPDVIHKGKRLARLIMSHFYSFLSCF